MVAGVALMVMWAPSTRPEVIMLRIRVAVALLLLASGTASARAIFPPDFSPTATVETFESLSPGLQTNPLTLDGVEFTDSSFLGVDDGSADFTNQQAPGSSMRTLYASASNPATLTIDFASPVDRAGLLLSSGGSLSWILVALDSSFNVVDNSFVTQPGTAQAAFGGFEDFAGIHELRVETVGPNPLGLFPHFDDLRYERLAAVSEPGSAPLFGAGAALLALELLLRRRKATLTSN
jgi:hypothetical protein